MFRSAASDPSAGRLRAIKVVALRMACKVIDDAIQARGGGVTSDCGLARAYTPIHRLRLAD